MIKVLIVDDSAVIRTLLNQIIEKNPEFKVVAMASNGKEAVNLTKQFAPDVIIMDILMPIMDGLEATKIIMEKYPTSILVFTTEDVVRIGFQAIEAGAIDIIAKPEFQQLDSNFSTLLHKKIETAAKANLSRKYGKSSINPEFSGQNFKIICIGASTGGPVAVQRVLSDLPKNLNVPVVVAQHIEKSFDSHYASWLAETTKQKVQLAEDGLIALPGHVYVAPADYHLIVSADTGDTCILRLNSDSPVHFLRPAVDKLFSSAAKVFKSNCMGVLLTGMGKDGAAGCVEIIENGGYTIGESENTCVVYGMPRAAVAAGGISRVLDLDKIGPTISNIMRKNNG